MKKEPPPYADLSQEEPSAPSPDPASARNTSPLRHATSTAADDTTESATERKPDLQRQKTQRQETVPDTPRSPSQPRCVRKDTIGRALSSEHEYRLPNVDRYLDNPDTTPRDAVIGARLIT